MSTDVDIASRRICSVCDHVVIDDPAHVHNVWRYYNPVEIIQGPVAGLDLEPANFAVITFAGWVDMNMRRNYYPAVGLS